MRWDRRKPYNFYAVTRGHQIGIFTNYEEVKVAVTKFPASGNMKGFSKREEAEFWLAVNLPQLENLRMPRSDDINLGFIGSVERVTSKIGILNGRLSMTVDVGDESGKFEFIYDTWIVKEDFKSKEGRRKIRAFLKPRDKLAKQRLRRFQGFIWLRRNPLGQCMIPKRPELELVKLMPFQSNEEALKKLATEYEEEYSLTVTATEENDLPQVFTQTLNSQEWRDNSADDLGAPAKKKSKDSPVTISSEEIWEIPDHELFDD